MVFQDDQPIKKSTFTFVDQVSQDIFHHFTSCFEQLSNLFQPFAICFKQLSNLFQFFVICLKQLANVFQHFANWFPAVFSDLVHDV